MSKIATVSLAAVLALPAIGCAEDRGNASPGAVTAGRRAVADGAGQQGQAQPETGTRRLESVVWNPVSHELTWVVSRGEERNGNGYAPSSQDKFQINLDNATMTFNSEVRRFSEEEAANVRMLMDLISKYAVDSTIWWQQGHGIKLDKDGKPIDGGETNAVQVQRVSAPARNLKPAEVDSEINRLEQQLRILKRQQSVYRATGLNPTSH